MKTIISLTFILLTTVNLAFSSQYEETMKSNINKIYALHTAADLQALANQFERIANVEKNEWLPKYYAAYCFIHSTVFDKMEADEKHAQLDKAQKWVDALKKQNNKESEVFALQAFLYQMRITDMAKGAKYSRLAGEEIAKAKRLNANNPRVYYLRGCNTYHTPKFFGGGADKAKPDLVKAAEIFKTTKPENALMPNWGAYHNQQLLDKCSE